MTGRRDKAEAQHATLRDHHRRHGTIPSMAGLARLWGFASKSSAARQVDRMLADGILAWSADRRLAPGPAFDGAKPGDAPETVAIEVPDPLPEALAAWGQDYDPVVVRSYAITARLLRLAQGMERGMAASAAREGLTAGDVLLLDALHRAGPPHRITATTLKHHFLITLAGVGKRVNRLEGLGFIARRRNPDDRRGQSIELTEAGVAALARLAEADAAAPHIIWPSLLSDSEFAIVESALARAEALIAHRGTEKERSSLESLPLQPVFREGKKTG